MTHSSTVSPKSPMEQRHLNAIDLLVSDASDFWAEDGTLLPVIREVRANIESQASGQRVVVDRAEIERLYKLLLHSAGANRSDDATITDCQTSMRGWLSHDSGEKR